MQWRGRRMSSNTGRGGGPAKIGGLGLIIFALIYSFFGGNVSDVINMAGAGQTQQVEQQASDPARRNMEDMLSVVLAAILRWPTCWRTKSATTCKTNRGC